MRTTQALVAVLLCCRCSALPAAGSSGGSMSSGAGAGTGTKGGSGVGTSTGTGASASADRMTGVSSAAIAPVVTQTTSPVTSASSATVNSALPSRSSASATTSGFTNGGGFSNSGGNIGLGGGILNGAGLSSGLIGVGAGNSNEQWDSGDEQVIRTVVEEQGSGFQGGDSYDGYNKHGKTHVLDLSDFVKHHRQVCIPEILAIALLAKSELGNDLKHFLSLLPYFHLGNHKTQELNYLSEVSRLLVDPHGLSGSSGSSYGPSDLAYHLSHLGNSGSSGRIINVASLMPSHVVSGAGKVSSLSPHSSGPGSGGQGKALSFLPHMGGTLGGISGGSGGLSHIGSVGSVGGILGH